MFQALTHWVKAPGDPAQTDSPAELEEDLLKHQNRAGASQDGERLPGKHGVGHTGERRPEQRLYGTLPERETESGGEGLTRYHDLCWDAAVEPGGSDFTPILFLLLCFLWWLLPANLRT